MCFLKRVYLHLLDNVTCDEKVILHECAVKQTTGNLKQQKGVNDIKKRVKSVIESTTEMTDWSKFTNQLMWFKFTVKTALQSHLTRKLLLFLIKLAMRKSLSHDRALYALFPNTVCIRPANLMWLTFFALLCFCAVWNVLRKLFLKLAIQMASRVKKTYTLIRV